MKLFVIFLYLLLAIDKAYANVSTEDYTENLVVEDKFESDSSNKNKKNWNFSLGLIGFGAPAFEGSKDYVGLIAPVITVRYENIELGSQGGMANIVNQNGVKVGLIVNYGYGRSERPIRPLLGKRTEALKGMGDVDGSLVGGVFVQYTESIFVVSGKVTYANGGYDGFVGEGKAGVAFPIFSKAVFSFGGQLKWAGSGYNKAFFGITEKQSLNTGLQQYEAKSGIVSYGVETNILTRITKSFSVIVLASANQMGKVPSDSPLIRERGSKSQYIVGVGGIYSF
jgi:outer membrane scaffolding protein for murein synthesis (MipA/OmpV family)